MESIGNLAQLSINGQGFASKKAQIKWCKRGILLDLDNLRHDLLTAAREDMRCPYDCCTERIDGLLVLAGFILPFALSITQFSGEFLPKYRHNEDPGLECPDCIEAEHPFVIYIWVLLVAGALSFSLITIYLLVSCRMKLNVWLASSLQDLNSLRHELEDHSGFDANIVSGEAAERIITVEQKRIVTSLGLCTVKCRDRFSHYWSAHGQKKCEWATRTLWFSVYNSVALAASMAWAHVRNRSDSAETAHFHFAAIVILGLAVSLLWIC